MTIKPIITRDVKEEIRNNMDDDVLEYFRHHINFKFLNDVDDDEKVYTDDIMSELGFPWTNFLTESNFMDFIHEFLGMSRNIFISEGSKFIEVAGSTNDNY